MAASVFELILARVKTVLAAGGTAAGTRVYRTRADAFSLAELPAISVRRIGTDSEIAGNDIEGHSLSFGVACLASGSTWETTADALHMAAHALLLADATLDGYGEGLRCVSTDSRADSAEQPAGHVEAVYQMQVFVNPATFSAVS